ncbi:DUF6522 family protein [Methylobacterium longum]|uniref:DUF6522 family protein n=1 Tax=Methylobacterium longum TaxID=767694 RepID=A0ABT8AVN0_9HYPH|nr:DUF6522 family protein [Methylobacterium longum]MDN3573328.1 DUF6522 family protein [Methylobacterium longum]GJE15133.1 hypothetical protein FOHLNKBM_6211 [Methylobacterium longum]
MRLDLGLEGDWMVDPRDLASRLNVSTNELKRLNRLGRVDAQLATGADEDTGLSRVIIRLSDRGWSGVFDESGALISEDAW